MDTFSAYKDSVRTFSSVKNRDAFKMKDFGKRRVYYAPFEYVNPKAKVVVYGITPGETQMENMLKEAKRLMALGKSDEEVLKECKHVGSFSGSMRKNLVAMLDKVGINKYAGVKTCEELFGSRADLASFSSCVCFPTFEVAAEGEKNFNSDITRDKDLFAFSTPITLSEIERMPEAVIVPLGPVVEKYLRKVLSGTPFEKRLLPALPHPSGANNERIAYFLGLKLKDQLSAKTNPQLIDRAKEEFARILSEQ